MATADEEPTISDLWDGMCAEIETLRAEAARLEGKGCDVGEEPLHNYEQRHLAKKRRLHDDGECAGLDCPYCEHERATKTGRFAPLWDRDVTRRVEGFTDHGGHGIAGEVWRPKGGEPRGGGA